MVCPMRSAIWGTMAFQSPFNLAALPLTLGPVLGIQEVRPPKVDSPSTIPPNLLISACPPDASLLPRPDSLCKSRSP